MVRLLLAGLLALAGPAVAQDDHLTLFGGDAFGSGATVSFAQEGLGDVFGAGGRVKVAAPIAGSAHLAGRRVATEGAVGGDVVAVGAEVTVGAPVAGSVTAAGYDVDLDADIGGNVRAMGRSVTVAAPVAGSAMLTAGTLTLGAPIGGDAAIDADTVVFEPDATVGGKLVLYGRDAGTIEVPAHVADAGRIERHPGQAGPGPMAAPPHGIPHAETIGAEVAGRGGWAAIATGLAVAALVLAAMAFVVALVAPRRAEGVAAQVADAPVRTIWIGFLTLSALIGACVVAMLTIVGVLAVPFILLVTAVACFVGYLFAVWALGRAIWVRFDRLPPDTVAERAVAAALGAVAVTLIGLVPFLGWPLVLLLTLAGLGALAIAAFRPEFGR